MLFRSRYIEDGVKSLLYFKGNMEAGLGTALWVLFSYLVVFIIICLSITYRTHKKEMAIPNEPLPSDEEKTENETETEKQQNSLVQASAPMSGELVKKAPSSQSVKATMITVSKDGTDDEWYRKALLNFTVEETNDKGNNQSNMNDDDVFRQALIMINKQN